LKDKDRLVASLQELLAQKEALDREIERTRNQERTAAIEQVRSLIAQYGLTAVDLQLKGAAPRARATKPAATGRKVAAKYRHPGSGDTWSGRGLQPKWLQAELATGKKLSDFAV
jgi:DNA-binding protein H-NS